VNFSHLHFTKYPTSSTLFTIPLHPPPANMCGTDGPNHTNGTSVASVCPPSSAPPTDKLRILISSEQRPQRPSNPYQPVADSISNVGRFKIIESTLRGQFPAPLALGSGLLIRNQRENNSPMPISRRRSRSRCWFPRTYPSHIPAAANVVSIF
jgi:hypothetical protein